MTLRKITIDNIVRYIPQNEERNFETNNQKKLVLFLVNKTKNFHKTIKKSLKT